MEAIKSHINELLAQWEETVFLNNWVDSDYCCAYNECIDELKQVMSGDLSPIEKW